MSDVYLIEVGGTAAGLVARDGNSYRFHAALRRFHALDGRLFHSPRHAERAANRLVAPSHARPNTGVL